MKLTKLLVLGAFLLIGKSAWAVDANVWTKPELPVPAEFVAFQGVTEMTDDNAVYLYNVKARLFYTEGNNWGTRASVLYAKTGGKDGPTSAEEIKGEKVWFLRSDNNKPEGVYELKSSLVNKNGATLSTFTDGVASVWADNNDGANHFWKVTESGGVIKISNADFETDKFFGWMGSYGDSRIYLIDPANEPNAGVEWKLVAPAVYEAWIEQDAVKEFLTKLPIYETAMALKEVLEKAEAANVNVTEPLAVYNNPESTKDELNAAIEAVNLAIEQHAYTSATADNPANVTSLFIKNPSYDNNKKDNWTWTADGNGEMGMGNTAAEFYMKVFDVHQTMSDLSEGVYSVDVQAFYRAGYGESTAYTAYVNNDPQSKDVKLYAVNGNDTLFTPITTPYPEAGDKVGVGAETEVTTASGKIYIPNDMQAAESYFVDKNRYHNTLFFCSDAGEATIGLKNSKSVDRNWVLFDNWSLKYYGNGADAYQAWWDYFVKDYVELPEGTIYSGNYMAAITGKTVTNKAEVLAGMAAAAVLDENMSLWKQWKEKVDEGFAAYQTYDEVLPEDNEELLNLLIYTDLNDEASDGYAILAAHSLTNDELNAEIVKVEALISAVVEAAKNVVKAGDDMTKYLTNPDFSEGEKGWTGWKTVAQQKWGNGTKNMPVVNESCAEAFSAPNFDLYQEVEGLPLGIYEVSVQGFFRFGRGDDAWNEWNKTGEDRSDYVRTDDPALGSPVFFYVNEKQTPFKNIFEEDGRPGDSPLFDDLATPANEGRTPLAKTETDGVVTTVENCLRVTQDDVYLFFPDGMKSAHNYFNANAYKQTTFSAVAHKGDKLRIGVKGRSDVGVAADNLDSWAIFDNFKLVYRGTDKDVVKPVLEDAIVVAKAKQKLSIAKDVKQQLATAISNAETAIANDADDMFSVLADLWSVDVNGSLQKIQDLKAALTPFENALNNADEAEDDLRPNQSVIDEATSVRNTAQGYVDGETEFSNADIESITERMKELTDALKVPAAMGVASDDNEANATYLIVNPTYEANTADRTLPNGWKQEGTDAGNYRANSGVYEVWNPHTNILAYQDLEKMPAGTYELSVQGVYRYGWADKEFEAYTADVNTYNYGYLYVKVGDSEPMTYPLPRLATLAEEYEVEYKVNDDGEPVLNDKGEKQYDPRDAWIWAQKNISEDESTASGYIMPDQLKTLTPFFEDETVEPTRLIFKVGEEGKARIGIDIKQVIDGNWVVWDNWKLTYYGPNSSKTQGGIVDGVQDVSAQADVVKTEVFNLSGAQVKNSKGVAIVRQTLNNGTVRVKKVIK